MRIVINIQMGGEGWQANTNRRWGKQMGVRRWQYFARQMHWWSVPLSTLPVLLIIVSGILLLLRREIEPLHPATRLGSKPGFSMEFKELLSKAKESYPDEVKSLADIKEIRIIPAKGVTKIRLHKDYRELQIDSHTGALLNVGQRWSALLIALHEGSFFSLAAVYWIYLPASLLLMVLWISGIYLFFGNKRWKQWIKKYSGASKT